jgi:putative DNA primase/helicase
MSASPAKTTGTSHVRLGSYYLNQHPNTIFTLGEWYRYREGIWGKVAELQVKKELQQTALKYAKTTVTSNLINSIYNLLKASQFHADETLDSNINLITFANCTLEVSTGKTRDLSPDDFVTSKLPFCYNPETRSDLWPVVLSSTDPAYHHFLQEYAGYCITPSTKYELALWNWGESGSGKSTFITGIETMLGSRVCTLGLADLERSAFALSQIPGKTLAISTEQPNHFIRSSHVLNALISGESILWERKFKDAVSIKPHVKLIWAMNELPRIDSSGIGLFRRVVPIHWRKVENPDPAIKEEKIPLLGQEIFNWAFEGLQRLNARGRFEVPAGLIAERETYRIQNDIPQVFIEEQCERVELFNDNGHYNRTQASILFTNYRDWCKDTNHKPLSSTTFAGELQRLGFEKKTIDGRVYYLGLLLKPQQNGQDPEVVM